MSDLAYTFSGDKFEVSPEATLWRVRRFKAPGSRGAPEVVYDEEGLPLTVPIDTTMTELREAVGNVTGRYRLDPLDDNGAAVGETAAYVQIRQVASKGSEAATVAAGDVFMHELLRANTEMMRVCNETTRVVTEKLAQIMESAAVLVRAADGAGIASRTPIEPHTPAPQKALGPGQDDDEEDDDECDDPPVNSSLAMILQMAIEKTMPLINHAIHTKVLGLSSAQSMALMGAAPTASPAPSPSTVPAESPKPTREERHQHHDEEKGDSKPASDPTQATETTREPIHNDPMVFMNHLAAIEQYLSPQDVEAVKGLVASLSPPELMMWRTRLMAATPEEGAALIRDEIKGRSS